MVRTDAVPVMKAKPNRTAVGSLDIRPKRLVALAVDPATGQTL